MSKMANLDLVMEDVIDKIGDGNTYSEVKCYVSNLLSKKDISKNEFILILSFIADFY